VASWLDRSRAADHHHAVANRLSLTWGGRHGDPLVRGGEVHPPGRHARRSEEERTGEPVNDSPISPRAPGRNRTCTRFQDLLLKAASGSSPRTRGSCARGSTWSSERIAMKGTSGGLRMRPLPTIDLANARIDELVRKAQRPSCNSQCGHSPATPPRPHIPRDCHEPSSRG
jgi:hypothetical protein